jgi:hypothetical protein
MKSERLQNFSYSLNYLRQVNDDQSFIRHFSQKVLKKIPKHVVQILAGTVNGDSAKVLGELHQIRSISRIYELNNIIIIISALEHELLHEATYLNSERDTVGELISGLERFCHELAAELDIQL